MVDRARMVLVVDDDPESAEMHTRLVQSLGYPVRTQCDPEQVEAELDRDAGIALVLLDLRMPRLNGLELLLRIKLRRPQIGVVMATVVPDIEHAVSAIKGGAYNYLLKPLHAERVAEVFDSYFSNRPDLLIQDPQFAGIITGCPIFDEIFHRVRSFAEADVTVLVQGETGTGKELIAERLHALCPHRAGPFVPVNMPALSAGIFEAELFGHRQGAFTGATCEHEGYFHQAAGGTVFLDEIGDLEMEQQTKLLRVLQTRRYCRVGESADRPLEAHVVLATNRDLQADVRAGTFREDLYFRLTGHTITLPPLRERPGDIELLSRYFVRKHASQYGRKITGLDPEALRLLARYPFPGNVRELEGMLSSAVLLEKHPVVTVDSLPPHVRFEDGPAEDLESIRYRSIMKALAECGGNQTRAARQLGISRVTLNRWLKEHRDKSSSA